MSSAPTLTTVKVTKQQLFSFVAVHARIPPSEPLLKKQNYGLFEDGVAFCRMFNTIFVHRTIAPIATSHQTSSASTRRTRNWAALHRAMMELGIPVDVVPRDLYRAGCGDTVGAYSGLVFFYFMHHLAKRRDFSAEFNADVTGSLMAFLQSIDSIRALVLGGAVVKDNIPPELHEYCSLAPEYEEERVPRRAGTASSISSVEHRDDAGSEANHVVDEKPLPATTKIGRDDAGGLHADAARELFSDSMTPPAVHMRSHTPRREVAQNFIPENEERFFEGGHFESAPAPHAASPRLSTVSSAMHGPVRPLSMEAEEPSSDKRQHDGHSADVEPQHQSTVEDADHSSSASMDDMVDVNASATDLQRILLQRCVSPEECDQAQSILWQMLRSFHVVAMRLRRAESRNTRNVAELERCEVDAVRLTEKVEQSEASRASLQDEVDQLGKHICEQDRQLQKQAALHHEAVARLTDENVRLRREREESLQQPLHRRCALLAALCTALRELDGSSMALISSNIEDDDVDEMLSHRTALQQKAALLVEQLRSVPATAEEDMGEVDGTTGSERRWVLDAMEERIRSVTASRDQLLEELQQLSEEASTWCEEATKLRHEERDWSAMQRRVDSLEMEVSRRNAVIDELRCKLSAAVVELDEARASVRRQREHSLVWSVPRPIAGGSTSPAARTPQTFNTSEAPHPTTIEAASVPRFRLSSPRQSASPRAPTEARVVDGPYNMPDGPTNMPGPNSYDAADKVQHHISLRDLNLIEDTV